MIDKIKKILKMSVALLKYYYYSIECSITKRDNSQVWLISERGMEARDNGYYLYKYLKKNHPEIIVKYVITSDSADSCKIHKKDAVEYGSREHYILFKTAGLLISTHIMGYSPEMSLFWRMDKRNKLKTNGRKVFLQHGIICNYEPSIDSDKVNLDLFFTSVNSEFQFIKSNNHYDDDVLKCTGLCRYDGLKDESGDEKITILVMPTFRKWLNYVNDFKDTEYFQRWNGLLNDKDFIDYIEKNKIKVLFYPHFEVQKHISEFGSCSKNVTVCSFNEYDVQDLLKKATVLITDYSSVQFDFAYMGKKVFYYQFDEKDFYAKHYKRGYFDFRKNGFGPVCTNINDLRRVLFSNSSWDRFSTRANTFFKYHDSNNSERVFNEIVKMNRKTVLHVVSSLEKGGTERYLINLLHGTSRSYRNVILYYNGTNNWQDELEMLNIKPIRLSGKNNNFSRMRNIRNIIKREKVDIIYSYTFYNSAYVMIAAWITGVKKRIVHVHRVDVDRHINRIKVAFSKMLISRLSTARLSCSDVAGRAFFRRGYLVVKNGIDLKKFLYNPHTRKTIRDILHVENDTILFGIIGRLDDNKNQSFAIDVFERYLTIVPNSKLCIIGSGSLKNNLKKKVHKFNLDSNVIFINSVNNIQEYYNAFDYYIMPSKKEGLPYVLIEAQANGLTVIASSGITEESKINDNFYFLDLNSGADGWATAIKQISCTRVKPSSLIQDYSIDNSIKLIKDIYEETK